MHMDSMGIVRHPSVIMLFKMLTQYVLLRQLHRDIKLTNIFIDSKGDCKGKFVVDIVPSMLVLNQLLLPLVGDFGLATTSAAVDPSDVSPHITSTEADMTLGLCFAIGSA